MNGVSLNVFFRDHGGDVLQEIDSAIFANASLPLFVATGRTLITQGCVTAPAEARDGRVLHSHISGSSWLNSN